MGVFWKNFKIIDGALKINFKIIDGAFNKNLKVIIRPIWKKKKRYN